MHRVLKIIIVLLSSFIFASNVHANSNESFITIVNPVRISSYQKDPLISLKTQYQEIKENDFPATWLVTYDVLKRKNLVDQLKKMDSNQEIGIFLEVTPQFSTGANVNYNQSNSWHRANSLFLSGYTQKDRLKLIDTVFSEFKKIFGFYPKSVGAWWVDSYSLSYMEKRYGITGNLGVSDQFDLDGYQVWGTPWSVPYYPSSINAAVPAGNVKNKIDVVAFRWAHRDPLNGYISPTKDEGSLYSTQDYERLGLGLSYFETLLRQYSQKNNLNSFGQITVGLESDYGPQAYSSVYSSWLSSIKKLEEEGVRVTNMEQFSEWYMKSFPGVSPEHVIEIQDPLLSPKKAFWIQNSLYRIGLVYNSLTKSASIVDFRVYSLNFIEPFYHSPNRQDSLSINLPYIIDTVIDPRSLWNFLPGELLSVKDTSSGTQMIFSDGSILFGDKQIQIKNIPIAKNIKNSNQISLKKQKDSSYIFPIDNFPIDKEGTLYKDNSIRLPFTIAVKIAKYKVPLIILGIILLFIFMISLKALKINKKIFLMTTLPLIVLLAGCFLVYVNKQYYISQTESDALSVLSKLPEGKVLVYDKDCLKCTFVGLKPAAAAGKKSYVEKISKQNSIIDFNFQQASTSVKAREILSSEKIKYIYLAKYENYIETLPYIPSDLGLKRVYENANAQIWMVNSGVE